MDNEKLRTAGTHFLEFAFSFLTFAKCQYQSANHIKINSLPFFTLSVLADQKDENYTMSDLADKLQITKQQLSKLINDLEDNTQTANLSPKDKTFNNGTSCPPGTLAEAK